MKRTLLFFLIFLPMLASADAIEINGIYYKLTEETKVAEVTRNPNQYEGDVTIPESVTYDDVVYSVASIADGAFFGCSGLTSITIGNGVISIGDYAFQSCTSLTSITIPSSVTSIGKHPFFDCSGLESIAVENGNPVYDSRESCKAIIKTSDNELISGCMNSTIPNSVIKIGQAAFLNCKRLRFVRIPNSVVSVGQNAFQGCSGMTSITIPNSVTSIGEAAFRGCSGLTSITIPNSVTSIDDYVFYECSGLTAVSIPNSVTFISRYAFSRCNGLTAVTIPNSVTFIEQGAFFRCSGLTAVSIGSGTITIGDQVFACCSELTDVYCYAESVPYTYADSYSNAFKDSSIEYATLHVPAGSVSAYQAVKPWKNFKEIVALPSKDDYRPFVEEGKVWKVGTIPTALDSPVQVVDYYYFDGDTIIGGKTCKQMMCQRYVSPDFSDEYWTPRPSLTKVGAWYEEDKKVYSFDERQQTMTLKYDFSLEANDTLHFLNVDDYPPFIIGPKQTGGLEGFKGVYREIMIGKDMHNTIWLEGVGVCDAPFRNAYDPRADLVPEFLISCTVGDEVIYFNDEYEDGATPESMGARKNRFDFTHTIKTKPKARKRSEEEPLLYGEYNDLKLGINLNPLDDAYQVRITDDSGKVVYEKAINAGNIVGLNIDISAYAKGRYTVTVENSDESFTGEFYAQATGIEAIINNKVETKPSIYNLQGQRLSSLQKGLNIVNGQKIFVK